MPLSSFARRASTIAAGLGIVAAGALAATGPAAAAVPGPCGAQKTARVSIHYKACVIKVGERDYTGQFLFSNNHGSAVSVFSRVGWSVEGNKHWVGGGSAKTLRAAPGFVQVKTAGLSCGRGESITAIVQVKQNNGDWGPIAYSRPYTCTD
ncbi:hypothetical protein M1L60_25015 [Actinoplanes sp. TRM 88003]|uniref:Secreted protein n=1 Tax=Paractinoplanes aksuensis TaxID=2939490 RepID=A0ABT1DSP4_9ACTN|nr:hypothetical protein [Actinoplanes aksuensis]MCO8273863.1 hypothetical protein [Actinoplanes aksuensis]